MADSTLMDILNPWDQLLEKLASLFLLKSLMSNYVIKELSTRTVLHDKEEFSLGFNDLNG